MLYTKWIVGCVDRICILWYLKDFLWQNWPSTDYEMTSELNLKDLVSYTFEIVRGKEYVAWTNTISSLYT